MSRRTMRPWAIGRRIQYGTGFGLFWVLVFALVYFTVYYEPTSCFDGKQSGDERGIDCGGSCVRICTADVLPPRLVWAKSFEIVEGQYNVVAYVDNQNQVAATPELPYTFELYNGNTLVATRSGSTILPPNSVYPIFEGRIQTDGAAPVTETRLVLQQADMWIPASVGRDQFRSQEIELIRADTRPRLDVEIENTALTDANAVEVVATIFNEGGEPVAASQTLAELIPARSTQDLVFTWPNPIAKTVRSCVIPTDVALGIDLSGSMNNDGGDPPQPISAALAAAEQFVSSLQENDQVAVVTFATEAQIVSGLSRTQQNVAELVRGLKIDAAEETGFTNTPAAFSLVDAVLNSAQHNENARRVLVLLTDGLPTAEGDEEIVTAAITAAKQLDETGIEIYAIGLGEGVDRSFIQAIATAPENAYFAPTGADLARIYEEITSALCELGPTKIDVIAKTKANFAPLR
ncbi:MAG: VWA domain-containing protein [Candidatus Kaiserbacteria bacterium]|nr:VWA domain-containing protein [Candidatus Kaiserbacteria bacterium]MCB9816343.1 VWA domain-containing protein [Candidatus Nomurabacteria bacterium]